MATEVFRKSKVLINNCAMAMRVLKRMETLKSIHDAIVILLQDIIRQEQRQCEGQALPRAVERRTLVRVGQRLVDVRGPGLQQVGPAEGQVAHRDYEVAALRRAHLPASHCVIHPYALPHAPVVQHHASCAVYCEIHVLP